MLIMPSVAWNHNWRMSPIRLDHCGMSIVGRDDSGLRSVIRRDCPMIAIRTSVLVGVASVGNVSLTDSNTDLSMPNTQGKPLC